MAELVNKEYTYSCLLTPGLYSHDELCEVANFNTNLISMLCTNLISFMYGYNPSFRYDFIKTMLSLIPTTEDIENIDNSSIVTELRRYTNDRLMHRKYEELARFYIEAYSMLNDYYDFEFDVVHREQRMEGC